MKHYERAYRGGPLSVTLYPISSPFPNKQALAGLLRERGRNHCICVTWIILAFDVATLAAYIGYMSDCMQKKREIQGHPKEKT